MENNSGQFSSHYSTGSKLGEGAYGCVYEGIRISDGQKVAIKFISKKPGVIFQRIKIPGYDVPLPEEVALNELLHKPEICPNIVQMLGWFEDEHRLILILECPQPCMTMTSFIRQEGRLCENEARHYMLQAVNAFKHCIDHGVYHNDMHQGNMLVNTEKRELKVIDFGCGKVIKSDVLDGMERPDAVAKTVYYLNKLLTAMISGTCYRLVVPINPRYNGLGLSEECLDLVNRYMKTSPTLEELLDHQWFQQT